MPFGSNRPFFLGLLSAAVGFTLILWGVAAATGSIRVTHHLRSLWPAGVAFVLAMTFAGLQIVDLDQVDRLLGTGLAKDYGHPIWQLAGETLGQATPVYVTVNPAKAEPAFLRAFICAGVFVLAFALSRRAASANLILTFVAVCAAFCVMAGLVQSALGMRFGEILTGDDIRDPTRFSSTFANPNHFATFAGIGLMAAVGLTFDALSQGIVFNRGRDIAIRTTMATLFGPALPGIACALIIAGGVIASGSRAGSFAMLIGCVTLIAILYFATRSSSRSGGSSQFALLMLGGILAAGVALASAPMLARINAVQLSDANRVQIAQNTMDAIAASPVAGNGFGAYIDYYPLYAPQAQHEVVNKAHNDFLEAIADLGVVGGAAFLFAPLYLVFLAARGAFRRRRGKIYGAVAAAAAALCGAHALFDFSMQIPAVAALFYATLGVGVAQAWRGDGDDGDPRMSA
jgi:hypothetical protein